MTAPNSQTLHAEVEQLARRLRLPYLRKAAVDVLPTAKAQRWDPAEVVRVLLAEEATGRDTATIANRRKRAGFPTGKTFDTWRETASTIPAATQQALRTLEWVRRAENLAVVGPSGTGKSHLEGSPGVADSREVGTLVPTDRRNDGEGLPRGDQAQGCGAVPAR